MKYKVIVYSLIIVTIGNFLLETNSVIEPKQYHYPERTLYPSTFSITSSMAVGSTASTTTTF